MQVRPGDEHYDEMFTVYKANKGTRFTFMNMSWIAVNDNDAVYFVLEGRAGGMDQAYQSFSTRQTGKPVLRN